MRKLRVLIVVALASGCGRRTVLPFVSGQAELVTGDSIARDEFVAPIGAQSVAGDSLAPGRYGLAALVAFSVTAPATSWEGIRVPAGIVQVRR